MTTKPAAKFNIQYVAPAALSPNPWNPNQVDAANMVKLQASIERLGFTKPIVCRTLEDGSYQILGGAHRWQAAVRMKLKEVPIVTLGLMHDGKAKEVSLVDNGRYGADDALKLGELLHSLEDMSEIAEFMPMSTSEMDALFKSMDVDLDGLDIDDEDEKPQLPAAKALQTHALMRFRVPIGDVDSITRVIEEITKAQKYVEEDSLSNAGHALVWLANNNAP